jgi:hypothetical protein
MVAKAMTFQHSVPPVDARKGEDMGYFSHYPVLARALAITSGPILELGMGWGSTPLISAMCQDREVWSVDTSQEWADRFKGLQRPNHQILWGDGPVWPIKQWSVVFIDSSPGEQRKDIAMALKEHAEFLVLHDHEAGSGAAYYYEQIMPAFKYSETYRLMTPHTLILSNTRAFGLSAFEQGY